MIVTTDKVYRNDGRATGYVEEDALGGDDPYSASKAMADLLTQSWVRSFSSPPTAVARAGNVIGGGDYSTERLLPDVMRACSEGRSPQIRNPGAVRPWQHVLDCLNGYSLLADHILARGDTSIPAEPWNFGPDASRIVPVGEVTSMALNAWGVPGGWLHHTSEDFPEAATLSLDSAKARMELAWRDRLSIQQAVDWTVEWYRGIDGGAGARAMCLDQIRRYQELA